jgi:serine/threonine protein kinase
MIEIGTILQNRYRIEKQIGQGGMGKVYVASDQRFNSTVAIKETVFEDKNLRRAFEREARLLNSLKHLALPRVSDHFIEGDGQFLVMEYIAGEDLAEMMEHSGEAFPLENVLNWANQLCDALDYLHSQDIIHRDIKPQNLKLTPGGQIVLLDFGLAKGNPTDSQHHTAAKSIFGYSRSYASLEQIQGTGTEPRSDLYSLAATLYHLLTGIPPADALTRAMNVLNGQPDPLIPAHLVNNRIPPGVGEILRKTMALNANERPVSASSLLSLLNECDKTLDFSAINVVPISFTGDLLTQETKIKSPTTNVLSSEQANTGAVVSTEGASDKNPYQTHLAQNDEESKITNIRPAAEITYSPRRGRAAGASVITGLLLAGSAITAVYFYNPGATQNNEVKVPVASEPKTDFVISVQENSAIFSSTDSNLNNDLNSTESSILIQRKQPASKSAESAKNNSKERKSASEVAESENSRTENEKAIIRNGRIETGSVIIDENGIRFKNQHPLPARDPRRGLDPKKPPIPPGNYRIFTPEQIRELEELRKIKPKVVVMGSPSPKPTPKQTP